MMKIPLLSVTAVATLAAAISLVCLQAPTPEHATVAAPAEGTKLLSRIPVAFVPNLGQWQHPARYVARVGAMTVLPSGRGGRSR